MGVRSPPPDKNPMYDPGPYCARKGETVWQAPGLRQEEDVHWQAHPGKKWRKAKKQCFAGYPVGRMINSLSA